MSMLNKRKIKMFGLDGENGWGRSVGIAGP